MATRAQKVVANNVNLGAYPLSGSGVARLPVPQYSWEQDGTRKIITKTNPSPVSAGDTPAAPSGAEEITSPQEEPIEGTPERRWMLWDPPGNSNRNWSPTAGIKLIIVPENFPESRLDQKQGDQVIQAHQDKMIAMDEGAPTFVKVAHETGVVEVVAHEKGSAE